MPVASPSALPAGFVPKFMARKELVRGATRMRPPFALATLFESVIVFARRMMSPGTVSVARVGQRAGTEQQMIEKVVNVSGAVVVSVPVVSIVSVRPESDEPSEFRGSSSSAVPPGFVPRTTLRPTVAGVIDTPAPPLTSEPPEWKSSWR